ncbi:hypothetical protein H4S06_002850 [Coemansia sp. BCRC 34490]|nr:hypothetical protein H4S06_002850 [Coemansia sp. BCRC 34490]
MCDRNLQISIKSKEDLGKIPIRELRAYLQLYGLYNPSTMLEKSDLVAAVYNNSPMPQIHEDKYRQSLPQPSEASYTSQAQNSQSTHSPRNRAGLDAQNSSSTGSVNGGSDGSWDRIFTNIGEEMGRAFESIGQQVGSGIERGASVLDEHASSILDPGRQTHRTQPGTNVFTSSNRESNTQNYDRSTYSVPSSNSRRQAQPRTQRSFYTEPRPQATQGQSSDPNRSTAGATTTSARQGRATASATTSAGARGDAARGSSSPAPQNSIPDVRLLVKDGTDPNTLGVKMLKGILKKNHVDFSNIVEKKELVERVERLVRNTKLEMEREATAAAAAAAAEDSSGGKEKGGGGSDDDVCKICWDASINCVFLNCGHMCTCLECGNRIVESDRRECPICRGHIAKVVHVFRV